MNTAKPYIVYECGCSASRSHFIKWCKIHANAIREYYQRKQP